MKVKAEFIPSPPVPPPTVKIEIEMTQKEAAILRDLVEQGFWWYDESDSDLWGSISSRLHTLTSGCRGLIKVGIGFPFTRAT